MAPTRRPSKSKYTADRGIPGAFEGETVTRRRFMTGTAHGAGALATMGFALPALAFAIGPIFKNDTLGWQTVGTPEMFPDDNYIPAVIVIAPGTGEAGNSTVYIRARNPSIDTTPPTQFNRWVAISTRCAHLGCPVRWVPGGGGWGRKRGGIGGAGSLGIRCARLAWTDRGTARSRRAARPDRAARTRAARC